MSVLGISAGEGLMVASQILVGVPRDIALIIIFITLSTRYLFAFLGFIIELFNDGTEFFKQKPSIKEK